MLGKERTYRTSIDKTISQELWNVKSTNVFHGSFFLKNYFSYKCIIQC